MSKLGRVAASALLLLVAACSGSAGSNERSAEREAQTHVCPSVTGDVSKDGTFTWMYSVGNTSFDPDKITTNNSLMYLYPVYDSLVHVDAQGKPQPMLAKSWKVVDGGTALEMKLISGWKYHDGTPFDAESVAANIERSKKKGSFNENSLKIVTGVKAVDATTVRFETNGGAGALVGVLGGSAGMMMSPAVFDKPGQDIKPTGGSGAFEMTKYVPGSRVEYTAVKDYWDPEAVRIKKLVFLISGDDNARLNAVTTGASDSTFLRASMYKPAKDAGLVVCERPSLSMYTINLNTSRSEFGNAKVREAINHAINREAVAAVTDGFCRPGVQMFPGFYFASNPGIGPERYAYDPKKAKQLLADAGLERGFSFHLEVVNLALYQQIAEIIQANLAEVGIKMSITPVDLTVLAEHFSVNKSVDAILFEQKAEADPSILTSAYYLENGFNNPGGWSSATVTELNTKAMEGATAEDRAPVYTEMFKAITDEVAPNVTLCHLTTPFVMNDKVKGMEIYADGSRQFRGVAIDSK